MENKVTLTMKEQHKLKMVIDYEAGKIRAQRAAELLGISKRQFRRIVTAYRLRGIAVLSHVGVVEWLSGCVEVQSCERRVIVHHPRIACLMGAV